MVFNKILSKIQGPVKPSCMYVSGSFRKSGSPVHAQKHSIISIMETPSLPEKKESVHTNVRTTPPYICTGVSHAFSEVSGRLGFFQFLPECGVYLESLVTHNSGLLYLKVVEHLGTVDYNYELLAFWVGFGVKV